MISIERTGADQIRLEGGYTPGLAKTVPGARFAPKKGNEPAHWVMPLSLAACHALRGRFGSQLRVGKALSSWARDAIAEEKRLLALGSASDADLLRIPDVSPILAKAMASRTYQRVAARFIAEGRKPTDPHPPAFATFEDGYRANCIVEAILESAGKGSVWTTVNY